MVLPRVLTACILVPLMLAVVYYGTLPFFLFVLAMVVFSLWEYAGIAEEGGYPSQPLILVLGGVATLVALYIDGAELGPIHHAPGPFFVLLAWSFVVFLREFFRVDKGHSFLRIITTITGVVLFGLLLGHVVLIRDLHETSGEGAVSVGRNLMYFLIAVIWSVDTGAWLVGRIVGRSALSPRISPKKTWEGAIGGTAIAVGAGWLMQQAYLRNILGPAEAIVFAVVIAVTAQVSDLAESLMKRSFGVKDSSQLLPGHGGILDRFDSFLFAAPFFYYILISTGRFH